MSQYTMYTISFFNGNYIFYVLSSSCEETKESLLHLMTSTSVGVFIKSWLSLCYVKHWVTACHCWDVIILEAGVYSNDICTFFFSKITSWSYEEEGNIFVVRFENLLPHKGYSCVFFFSLLWGIIWNYKTRKKLFFFFHIFAAF